MEVIEDYFDDFAARSVRRKLVQLRHVGHFGTVVPLGGIGSALAGSDTVRKL